MSSTFIARVFVSGAPIAPEDVMQAIGDVVNTASYHGSAWHYGKAPLENWPAIGALVCFDMGLASPHYCGRDPAGNVCSAIRRALRKLAGRKAMLEIDCIEADRLKWSRGLHVAA